MSKEPSCHGWPRKKDSVSETALFCPNALDGSVALTVGVGGRNGACTETVCASAGFLLIPPEYEGMLSCC